MQILQGRARVQSEVVGECGPRDAVDLEGIGGTSQAVQGEHVQLHEAVPDAVAGGQPGQFGQQFAVAAQFQPGGHQLLHRVQAQFVEVGTHPLAQPVRRVVAHGGAAPKGEGRTEQPVTFGGARGPGGRQQPPEPVHVHHIGIDVQHVALPA